MTRRKYISDAMHEVVKTLIITLVIVSVVIFLFLGSFRSVLIPLVAIPLSLIGAVFLMQVFGFTLNLLTLLAIVLAVGLVVDDAIVVVENMERHIREGKTPVDAALLGARELVGPVIAMTITLAAVYAPIAFQGGLTGSLFREFALTLAGAVFISGIVALTLSPVMASRLLSHDREEHGLVGRINRDFDRLKNFYGRVLDWTLARRPMVYTIWIGLSLLTIPMFKMAWQAKEPAPAEDQGVIFGVVETPPDATIEQTSFYADLAGQLICKSAGKRAGLPAHHAGRRIWRPGAQAVGRAEAHRVPDPAGSAGDGEPDSRHPHVHGHAVAAADRRREFSGEPRAVRPPPSRSRF